MNLRSRLAWLFVLFLAIGFLAGFIGWSIGHVSGASALAARPDGLPTFSGHPVICFGYVDVENGVTALAPLRVGRVAELLVKEGQGVPKGASLLRLKSESFQAHRDKADAAVAVAEAQLAQARQLPAQHETRLAQQRAAVEAGYRRLTAAEHNLIRKRDLQRAKQLNVQEVAAAHEQVEELKAVLQVEKQKLAELELSNPALDIRRAEAEAAAARATLTEARHALDECILKAPEAGTVLRVLVGPGDLVGGQASQPALMFCVQGARLIRAEVEQEYVPYLATGVAALAEDDSRSGGTWRGKMTRISDWYTKRRAVMREPMQSNDVRTVECVIELEPGQTPVRIGQRMRVVIRTDSHRSDQAQLRNPKAGW